MRLWHIARARLRSLLFRRQREAELAAELRQHIEREAERLEASGVTALEARRKAARVFGGMDQVMEACRDERRTAVVDNLARDIRYAFRSFRREPLSALTIMGTVALGLGLMTVAFTVLNIFLFRVDEVPNVHELFAVERPPGVSGEPVRLTRSQYDALVRETQVFSASFARLTDVDSRRDGQMLAGTLVTPDFFDVLGVGAAMGRTFTPADDSETGGAPVVVLSHRGWSQHFARDPAAIGRVVPLSGVQFEVIGVMPESFRGLAVAAPDYWAPLSVLSQIRPAYAGRESQVPLEVIGRLSPGLSTEQALAELHVWDARQTSGRTEDRARARLVFEPRQGTVPRPLEAWLVVAPIFVAFGLILLIGCANVANLLLARGVARQREIGIRLATGASRARVVTQLLTESVLLALGSAALGYLISRAVLSGLVAALTNTMPPDIGDIRLDIPPADWRVALFLVGGALATTMAFSLAPALNATRVELVRAIRGEVVRDARPGRARDVLVGVQVTASVLLLICSAVFLRSALDAATLDPGIRTVDTVAIGRFDESKRQAVLDALRREPSVAVIAASSPDPLGPPRRGVSAGESGTAEVTYKFVSPQFFDVLGVELLAGRPFEAAESAATASVAVVSESFARRRWPGRAAVGQVVRIEPERDPDAQRANEPQSHARVFTVVGVARDVPGFRFFDAAPTDVYLPAGIETEHTALTLRVHGSPEVTRRVILDRLFTIDPGLEGVFTLRTAAGMETYFLQIGFWLTLGLGALALALTLSGLFSVLTYLVQQRSREIGVRLALGATPGKIGGFVVSQLARPVLIGTVAGCVLAVALGGLLLASPAGAYVGAAVPVFDPAAYAGSLAVILVACAAAAVMPALRASRIDPITTLRRD